MPIRPVTCVAYSSFAAIALAVTLIAIEARSHDAAESAAAARRQRGRAHRSHRQVPPRCPFPHRHDGMRYFDCSGLVYRVYQQAGLLSKIGGSRMRAASYYSWFRKRGLVSRSNPQAR